jgi:hypothetical protein
MGDKLQEFFSQEMNDQSHYENEELFYDDYAQGVVEFESYDPVSLHRRQQQERSGVTCTECFTSCC